MLSTFSMLMVHSFCTPGSTTEHRIWFSLHHAWTQESLALLSESIVMIDQTVQMVRMC